MLKKDYAISLVDMDDAKETFSHHFLAPQHSLYHLLRTE